MSGGTPTEAQLDRIVRRVAERIERRRARARAVLGAGAGVALLAGAVLVLPHVVGGVATGSAAGTGGSAAGSGAAARVVVVCRLDGAGGPAVRTTADAGGLPASAVAACRAGSVDFQSGRSRAPSASSATAAPARSSPTPAVVCRGDGGVLTVLPGPPSACRDAGLRPY